ncbi:aminotransferase class III-fold pyridoxal phosphate-dependent enzyme [Micrococcus luteus]|uniref:aminotransferase class III-fold pyridoxal phosphate-dependent enzyme n=1 Tax=Micrococcus luteus TaxID=1270 RepID=UPI0033F69487
MTDHARRRAPLTERERADELAAYARDERAIAGVERLRFFPLAVRARASARPGTLTAASGRELIDLSASWTASGLAHPAIGHAIADAARSMAGASVLSAAGERATRLAERLIELVPVRGRARAYLGLAGTDANDVALRAARAATGRNRVLAFEGSYHGGLGLAQAISGLSGRAEPAALLPYPADASALEALPWRIAAAHEEEPVAAIIVEPIQCDGGVRVPPAGLLLGLRAACDEIGALLIVDEVKTGLGRTGTLLASEAEAAAGAIPDLVTLGKSLGGGLPVSAAIGDERLLGAPPASALLTAAGADVPCAAALAALELAASPELAEAVRSRALELDAMLEAFAGGASPGAALLGQTRGRGLLRGLALAGNAQRDAEMLTAKAAYRAWELGAIAYPVQGGVLEITPPLAISGEDLAEGIARLLQAIDDVAEGAVPDAAITSFAGW